MLGQAGVTARCVSGRARRKPAEQRQRRAANREDRKKREGDKPVSWGACGPVWLAVWGPEAGSGNIPQPKGARTRV